ncbi:MAG: hypothetical protein PHV42_00805 [Candidatus Pacebacteria bacterium]|nr:hypothetical protein [Candidatus Paceibacterota bacterium]
MEFEHTPLSESHSKSTHPDSIPLSPEKEWDKAKIAEWIADKMTELGMTDVRLGMQEYLLFRKNTDTADVSRFLSSTLRKLIKDRLEQKKADTKSKPKESETNTNKARPKEDENRLFPFDQDEIRKNTRGFH